MAKSRPCQLWECHTLRLHGCEKNCTEYIRGVSWLECERQKALSRPFEKSIERMFVKK